MKSFQNKKYPELAHDKECTGCLACVDICPKDAIGYKIGDDGHVHVFLNKEKCVGCKVCEKVCLSSRTKYGNNNLKLSKVYSAWSQNNEDRRNATSGGVFAAVARYVIKNGGVVIGASLQGRDCRHILVKEVKDIAKVQGSKYMYSSMSGIYRIIERELINGIVLFSGVGCQCAGVLAYFEKSKFRDNLITMDLVCGGAPSRLLIEKFYEENPNIEQILSFRSKDKYELKVKENGCEKIIESKSLPLQGFNCELTNRLSCYHCQYSCAHRQTDITIGDLWNYDYMPEEHSKGISTVIIHSEKGKEILNKADIVFNDMRWDECIDHCTRIVWGNTHIFYPRKKLEKNSKNFTYEKFRKVYCMDIKPNNIMWFVFRIYRFVVMRAYSIISKLYIYHIKKTDPTNTSQKN